MRQGVSYVQLLAFISCLICIVLKIFAVYNSHTILSIFAVVSIS